MIKAYEIKEYYNGNIFLHGIYAEGQLETDMGIDFVSTDNDFLVHEIMASTEDYGIIRCVYVHNGNYKPCDMFWWRSKHFDKTRMRGLVFYLDDKDEAEIRKYAMKKMNERSDSL